MAEHDRVVVCPKCNKEIYRLVDGCAKDVENPFGHGCGVRYVTYYIEEWDCKLARALRSDGEEER